jgi:uncharacterized glyoxalase superfamily protein PhnB
MPAKSKKTQRPAVKPKKFEPVPKDFHAVTAYLAVKDTAKAIDWYAKVFGARELKSARELSPAGGVMHARFKIGDSLVMISDIFPGSGVKDPTEPGRSPVALHVYTKDADAVWKRAVDGGAKVDMPIGNMFWGERYGMFTDPFGHAWSVAMRVPMSRQEMARMREEMMKTFSQRHK